MSEAPEYRAEPRWRFTQRVTLSVFEDHPGGGGERIYAPPSRVVEVDVIGERVFLTFAKYEEDNTTSKTTKIQEEIVSAEALLLALISQMGVEYVQGVLRRVAS